MAEALCAVCGEPMPEGETMFNYHGYSGPCPKPTMTKVVGLKKRPGPIEPVKDFKNGNLLGEVPLDVPYAGCSHLDCIKGCDLGKGHCQRLEVAFLAAGCAQS